ncbi:MAG TPA: class I SAM-dependent methyltransferase [Polyangiaceae bacterium]|nr:class I SAM-dependent methyltransferase [Polyangiaceae bacterium]
MAEALTKRSGWETWHDWNVTVMKPSIEWFCDAIHATQGQVVLDLACGTGIPSLGLAERVAPNGRVIATDSSADMVGAVRRMAEAAGIRNLEAREMGAMALDFPDASFDAVTCKDGVMFCADPVKTLAEMRRVLKPGGRFALTVWDEPAKCMFFMTIFGPVRTFLKRPPPDPGGPGPFRLSAPGELENNLSAAGFSDFEVTQRDVFYEFASLDEHFRATSAMAAPLETAVATLPADELAQLKRAIAEGLKPFMVGERVRVPNVALCATGRR